MRHFLLALLLACGAGSAALACTCIAVPRDSAERQSTASDVADGAVALVEVELAEPFEAASRRGERLRVVSTLAGAAPAVVEIERDHAPDEMRCDVVFRSGERVPVLLYPARQPGEGGAARFRLADRCLTALLADEPFRAALIRAMGSGPALGAAAPR